jgi:hypothetical protein
MTSPAPIASLESLQAASILRSSRQQNKRFVAAPGFGSPMRYRPRRQRGGERSRPLPRHCAEEHTRCGRDQVTRGGSRLHCIDTVLSRPGLERMSNESTRSRLHDQASLGLYPILGGRRPRWGSVQHSTARSASLIARGSTATCSPLPEQMAGCPILLRRPLTVDASAACGRFGDQPPATIPRRRLKAVSARHGPVCMRSAAVGGGQHLQLPDHGGPRTRPHSSAIDPRELTSALLFSVALAHTGSTATFGRL